MALRRLWSARRCGRKGKGREKRGEERKGARAEFPSESDSAEEFWQALREDARALASEPALASFLFSTVVSHKTLEQALAYVLANKLGDRTLMPTQPLLFFKGFQALQAHRIAHRFQAEGRTDLATAIHSRVARELHVDIHPRAVLGTGIMCDHAEGIVIGETARVGSNVSMLHHVTLGGSGSSSAQRHPCVADDVLIGASATLLGNISIGGGAKIGAGSLVLEDVPAGGIAVGVPAKLIGKTDVIQRTGSFMDHTLEFNI